MNTPDYSAFSTEDFLADDDFVSWCLAPDEGQTKYWNNWLTEHPEKELVVKEAKELVALLRNTESSPIDDNLKVKVWEDLQSHLDKDGIIELPPDIRKTLPILPRFAVAASIAAILLLYFGVFRDSSKNLQWVEYVNKTEQIESILLDDNSRVDLHPHSTIQHRKNFASDCRELILEGEAFFDVERDEQRPFRVYANRTTTQVLGTSFRINATDEVGMVEVEVVSGKVSVSANSTALDIITKENLDHIESRDLQLGQDVRVHLLPNEKATFNVERRSLTKSIVETPLIIERSMFPSQKIFENAPVLEMFDLLERAYGVQIEQNDKALINCSISTQLDDAPLFTKLQMICTALSLEYVEKNAVIYIKGRGCEE